MEASSHLLARALKVVLAPNIFLGYICGFCKNIFQSFCDDLWFLQHFLLEEGKVNTFCPLVFPEGNLIVTAMWGKNVAEAMLAQQSREAKHLRQKASMQMENGISSELNELIQ